MSPIISPVLPMTDHALYEIADVLENKIDASMDSLTIFQGNHPEHGPLTVVISSFSEGFVIKASPTTK